MQDLAKFRTGKPVSYPDQSIYAEFACIEFGLTFADIVGGTGLVFCVASKTKHVHFGAGRCCWYPQNAATAATLASDKYFTNVILERAAISRKPFTMKRPSIAIYAKSRAITMRS